jgi:hypothetical protein
MLDTIEQTADYYHSMISDTSPYWLDDYRTALDILERVQGLPEGSLMIEHNNTCDCGLLEKEN